MATSSGTPTVSMEHASQPPMRAAAHVVRCRRNQRKNSPYMSHSEVTGNKLRLYVNSVGRETQKILVTNFISRHRRQTQLHEAVIQKDLKLIRHVLDHSPLDFGVLDVNGRSPLVQAILDGAWKLVSAMLESITVDIVAISRTDVRVDIEGSTVYHKLRDENLMYDDVKVLRELIGRDPNFNVVNFHGQTPLHTAKRQCHLDVFCTVHNVNAQDYKGLTPLHIAIRQKNLALAQTLLQHGADVRLTDELFNTPVHFVDWSTYDKFSPIFTNVNMPKTRNVFGQLSPLLWLPPDGDVDVNYRDFLGNSALHIAAADAHLTYRRRYPTVTEPLFLSDKFDAKSYTDRNVFGQTPLHIHWIMSVDDLSTLLSHERLRMLLMTTDGRGRNMLHYIFLIRGVDVLSKYINDVYNRQQTSFSHVDSDEVTKEEKQIAKKKKVPTATLR